MRRHGFLVLVLDPLEDPGWPTPYRYTNRGEFLKAGQNAQRCLLIIDEAGEMIGQFNEEMRWCATRARHLGHTSMFITQRPAQLSPTVRDQCSKLFLFRVSVDDAKTLARDWARPELEIASTLPQGQALAVPRFGDIQRINVFDNSYVAEK